MPQVLTPTLGSTVDADIAVLKADVAALKTKAEADAKSAVAWIKTNWPHFVTYLGLGYAILKHVI